MSCSSYRGTLVKPGEASGGLTRRLEVTNLSCESVLLLTPEQLYINSLFYTLSGEHRC